MTDSPPLHPNNHLTNLFCPPRCPDIWHLPASDYGADRSRTDDLLNANQALSQLSYGPDFRSQKPDTGRKRSDDTAAPLTSDVWHLTSVLVGLGRLELPTSRLSSARSNQLSYRPGFQMPDDTSQMAERPAACRPVHQMPMPDNPDIGPLTSDI